MRASWIVLISLAKDGKGNELLILKRSPTMRNPGQWCLAGGSSKRKKPRKLANKEAREEIGIDLKQLDKSFKLPKLELDDKDYHYYIYFVDKNKLNIILDHESTKYKWVGFKKLKKHKLHKSVKLLLKHFL